MINKKLFLISFIVIFISGFSSSVFASSYTGPLYDAGIHLDKNQPFILTVDNMKRNNIQTSVAFFGVKKDDAFFDINDIRLFVKRYPNKILPFLIVKSTKKKKLKIFKKDYVDLLERGRLFSGLVIAGKTTDVFNSISNSNDKTDVLKYLNKKKLMIISNSLEEEHLGNDLRHYPQIRFIDNNSEIDLKQVEKQLITFDNYYYSLSISDVLGMKDEKQYNLTDKKNAMKFKTLLNKNYNKVLANAVSKYKPFIENNPNQVMWGTNFDENWNFASPVYNLTAKFSRDFISKLKPSVRSKFAYQNAKSLYRNGINLAKNPNKTPKPEDATSKKIYFVLFLVVIPSVIAIISILIAITRRG